MNDTIDYQHKPALLSAKTKLEFLESIPDSQWNIVQVDNNDIEVYTCTDSNEISNIRVIKELESERTNLGSFQASLSNIELRGIWCPWLQNIKLLGQPSSNINVIQASITFDKSTSNVLVLVEKTTKKDDNIQFVSASTSSNDSYFMACNLSSTRATLYYQWGKSGSITYTGSVLSKALTDFIDLKSFSWISQYDLNTIQCSYKHQNQNKLEIDYTYLQENRSTLAVDIQQKLHRSQLQRWDSGSWDQQKHDSYNQAVRKNKFLSSSSLVFTTASPQLHSISTSRASYPENSSRKMIVPWAMDEEVKGDQLHTTRRLSHDRDNLRLEVKEKFNLTISLPQNPSWSDRFSQLCVRCYRRRTMSDHDYVIQIIHPQKLIEYLRNEDDLQEENDTLKQLDDDLSGHIRVALLLKKSDNGQCMVNNREWPIRAWTISSDEDNDCDDDDDDGDGEEEDEKVLLEDEQDIFVDGMEQIDHGTSLPPIAEAEKMRLPAMKPSSSAPVPSVIKQDKESVNVYTQPNFISDLSVPAAALSLPVKTETNQSQTIGDNKRKKQIEQQAQIINPSNSNQLNLPSLSLTEDIDHKVEEQEEISETVLPEHDPAALQKIYPQFVEYLQPSYKPVLTVIQPPDRENGNVTIKKIDITNHPMGGYLSESTWKDCSIWDVKAVLESAGARKIWDNTFESTTFLHALTPTSSLWHTKIKGAWPNNPRDYVCFQGQYSAGSYRIDLLSTSCFGDSYQYKPLPAQEVPGYTRAIMDVSGWRLERVDDKTTSVKQLMVTQFSTWVIGFITSRFLVQSCAAVQSARDYLQTYGAPPSLENLTCGLLVNVKHDHERKNWRCEYIRRISGVDNTDVDGTIKKVTAAGDHAPSTVSLIRLDKRRWATNNQYAVVIDPPPSRVSAVEKFNDPYGVWLTVEHDEAFIIPLRGKILVLIKPEQATKPSMDASECQLYVNGVPTTIQIEERKPKAIVQRSKQASFPQFSVKEEQERAESELQSKDDTVGKTVSSATVVSAPRLSDTIATSVNEEEKILTAINQLNISPKEHAQAALAFLKQTDEQFGWTVLSDSKSSMRISKKSGAKNNNVTDNNKKIDKIDSAIEGTAASTNKNHVFQVFEPYMVYKGSKVIENFSVEEVAAVVTDIGHVRKAYDDTIEREGVDLVHQTIDPGCRVIRLSIKALFPFKNREAYAVSCLAEEEASSTTSTKRTFYVESSLPDFPTINSKKTRGHLFMSGWILEAIDPYNTTTENHPIPSMRATYVAALDLGNAVPSYISNLVANNWFPKKINAVESYLKSKGPPPFTTQPNVALTYANNTLSFNPAAATTFISCTYIHSTYDDQHQFKMTSRFKLLEANTKAEQVNKKKPKKEDILVLSPSTSSSTSSTAPPYRRPSNHTISSGPNSRRGSLQTSVLPKKRIMPVVPITPAPTSTKSSSNDRSYTILQTTFDLRNYTKGYEIQTQLYHILKETDHRKNMSNKLVLSISEPSLSHLMDGKKKLTKHCITIKAHGLSLSEQYAFEFSLAPLQEETAVSQGQKLTVSHVLGEDEDEQIKDIWHGLIMVNGVEAFLNKDIELKLLHPEETSIESTRGMNEALSNSDKNMMNLTADVDSREITADESYSSRTVDMKDAEVGQRGAQYTGGNVVTTALGNVSAGVNNFGARMMIPFRAASFSLSSNSNEPSSRLEESSTFVPETTDDEDDDDTTEGVRRRRFTKDEKRMISSSTAGTTLHEIRMLRRSSDTMRKGMLLLMICLGLAVVFALLMIQPMMERYYASFSVSSSVNALDKSIEQGIVHRLLQIPWFGGWNIQVIAVRGQ